MCKVICDSIGSTHLCDGCGASKIHNGNYCEPCPANGKAKCMIVPMGIKHVMLGAPRTIGELKKLINRYPDNTDFGFRNQPIQTLCHVEFDDKMYIVFQI